MGVAVAELVASAAAAFCSGYLGIRALGEACAPTISGKGKLLYAAGHTFGRCTQLACQVIHRFSFQTVLAAASRKSLHFVVSSAWAQLSQSKPRRVTRWSLAPPVLVFTDGAVEDDVSTVTHGALLFDLDWTLATMFLTSLSSVGSLRAAASHFQSRFFPILVAKATWASTLQGRSILWFVDS